MLLLVKSKSIMAYCKGLSPGIYFLRGWGGEWVAFEYDIMCRSKWKSKVLCQIIYQKSIHLLRTIVVFKLFLLEKKTFTLLISMRQKESPSIKQHFFKVYRT